MTMNIKNAFKHDRAAEWTPERLSRMTAQEIKQLRENAERLNEAAVAQLCSDALAGKRRAQFAARRSGAAPRTRARHLIARSKAFEARGVYLTEARSSWGGVRKTDGAVVLALWANAVVSTDGTCRYLLWSPNTDGARPWSDSAGGRERLEHCKRAIELGSAEGLLVYGDALEGVLPEEKAHAVHGVDAEVVLTFTVEQVGPQYWAVWGKKTPQ
jgi:hypothetical protein